MKFSFLVVNYNTERHILDLLDNLAVQSCQDFEMIIVNNVQNNTLTDLLAKKELAFRLQIIQSPHNVGFGRAMNLGAKSAVGEHFLITNPDIIISDNDFLQKLATEIEKTPNYGAMTCQLFNEHDEDKSEFVDFEFHHTLGLKNTPRWLSGAFLFFRKEIYQQLNGFDEDFFMYCEDEDICYRVQKMGLKLEKINSLSVRHIGGVSEPIKGYDFFYRWFRSQLLFAYKHFAKDEFKQLLSDLHKKSNQKCHTYYALKFLKVNLNRSATKFNEWSAMKDVVQKTLDNGVDWLYFKLDNEK